MGIIPNNTSGFGSPDTAAEVFARNELQSIQHKIKSLNNWIGEEVVKFEDRDYQIKSDK